MRFKVLTIGAPRVLVKISRSAEIISRAKISRKKHHNRQINLSKKPPLLLSKQECIHPPCFFVWKQHETTIYVSFSPKDTDYNRLWVHDLEIRLIRLVGSNTAVNNDCRDCNRGNKWGCLFIFFFFFSNNNNNTKRRTLRRNCFFVTLLV